MKAYFVVQRYGSDVVGGAEAACRELARRSTAFADVTVFTTCALESTTWANHYPKGESRDGGVRVVRFPTTSERNPRLDRYSARLFRKAHPSRRAQERWFRRQGPQAPRLLEAISDSADEPDVWAFYTYLYYPTIFGMPKVASRAVLHPALHDEPPARLPLVREVLRSPVGLWLHTHEELEALVRLAGWPRSRLTVGGLGVEDRAGDGERFLRQHDLGSDPYLLYLGRVDRGKGTDLLADSFAAYKKEQPGPLKLVIAGPVVHPPPPHTDIILTGRLTDEQRWDALEGCTLFVHPSPLESFGLALLEAWMRGKPALVNARSPVLAGHVGRARGGLAFGDLPDFLAALQVLLDDPEAAARLGEAGRAYAQRFHWDQVMDRYRGFLALNAERPPAD